MSGNKRVFSPEHQDPHSPDREVSSNLQDAADSKATDREHDDLIWERGSNLAAPQARPGFVQQWIRIDLGGQEDRANLSKKLGPERWKPRRKETFEASDTPTMTKHQTLGDILVVAGMVLCERPMTVQRQRDQYFEQRRRDQMTAVNANLFREEHSSMPIYKDHRTTVEGVKRKVAPDE